MLQQTFCTALQAQYDLSNPYYSSQQYHDWYNHYVQYYGQYPLDHPAPQYAYAATAPPQAGAAPWAPAQQAQPVVLPAPAQQAAPAPAAALQFAPRPAAQQHPRYVHCPAGSPDVKQKPQCVCMSGEWSL